MSNVGSLYLFSLVSSLCLLFGLNFLIRKGNLVVAKILAVQFLILGYLVVAAYYLMPEVIVVTPYFYRTSAPLFYILPPLNFMFLWYLLHPRAKFKWIHISYQTLTTLFSLRQYGAFRLHFHDAEGGRPS